MLGVSSRAETRSGKPTLVLMASFTISLRSVCGPYVPRPSLPQTLSATVGGRTTDGILPTTTASSVELYSQQNRVHDETHTTIIHNVYMMLHITFHHNYCLHIVALKLDRNMFYHRNQLVAN